MFRLFAKTNDTKEFKDLNEFSLFADKLVSMDEYISKKCYLPVFERIKPTYDELTFLEKKFVFRSWCRKNKTDRKKLKALMAKYRDIDKYIDKHNQEYVNKHLELEKDYLDKILVDDDPNVILDEEQRRVVLSDEDNILVVAGAGSGKTTTIEAKVKYLVDRKNVDPNRILIVSFTKKATGELEDRFKRLKLPVKISTFHSIGNAIIHDHEDEQHRIVENGFMYKVLQDYFINQLDDEEFIKKILLFFASYLNVPTEETNVALLFKQLEANDTTTLKSDLEEAMNDYIKEQTKSKVTIKDERVRSIDECRIANFLFINGIDYEYEPLYPHGFEKSTKAYCPDFVIKNNDEIIYLEHFGISQSGRNNRFTAEELEEYKKHVNDKIALHKKYNTKLIYTFSKYNDGRDLIQHLEQELKKNSIALNRKKDIEIYRKLADNAQDKYFNKFIILVCNFISKFKINNFDKDTKFDEWLSTIKNERTKLFVEIAKQCFKVYESKRIEVKGIDFEDMINNAVEILDDLQRNKEILPYDYVLVDEYQDISIQRFDLCEKLSKVSHAKIIAVGDDWQSIFRFSGARIDLFTQFEKKMGYAQVLKITNTYRNSQELIDIAGDFVMQNQKQIKKDLKSTKRIEEPVILMSYDDSFEKDQNSHGPFYRLGEAIEKSLDDIVARNGLDKSVLLIGRYRFDYKRLSILEDFFYFDENNRLHSKKYPKLNLSYMTAHASKGLGRDNVIIINGKDDILGFPSKIEDDPVMKLVITKTDEMDFEEERRLFYVALTRTKNRVYIVTPQLRTSKFILEIKKKFPNVVLKGEELNPIESNSYKYICPQCGYPLQRRKAKYEFLTPTSSLWICSNDPEVCGFLTNDVRGGNLSISKCPACSDGYLIVKKVVNASGANKYDRILGCSNYKKDGTGCNFSMNPDNFTQDKLSIVMDVGGNGRVDIDSGYLIRIPHDIIIIKRKYPSFDFNYSQLCDFLVGNKNKTLSSFNLYKEDGYGLLREYDVICVKKLINAMLQCDILGKGTNEKGYERIIVKRYINLDDAKEISKILKK